MKFTSRFWLSRFIFQLLLWEFMMVALVGIIFGLVRPLLDWLFHDVWQWHSLEMWLRYTLAAMLGSLIPATLFTYGEWLEHGGATTSRKWVVAVLVIATLLVVQFVGIQAVKHQVVPALLRWLA